MDNFDSFFPPSSPSSFILSFNSKSAIAEEDAMELIWHDGQVPLQIPQRKLSPPPPQDPSLFIHEHEMASWLHHPLHHFHHHALSSDPIHSAAVLHAPPENDPTTVRDFANFSRLSAESGQPSSSAPAEAEGDLTRRTEGSDTRWTITGGASSAASAYGISGASSSGVKAGRTKEIIARDRERKRREAVDETECRSEKTEEARGSTSSKRHRSSKVHNLTERRRRGRINERIRALHELIPFCNKTDKASILGDTVEYVKALHLQLQMYSMMRMMYPGGMQQYMQQMAMGMGMNTTPLMPYPNMAATPFLPTMAAHMDGPVFPFPILNVHAADPSRGSVQSQKTDPAAFNSLHTQQPNQQALPGLVDPNQQFLGLRSMQASMLQNQARDQPSSNDEIEDPETPPAEDEDVW